MATSSEQRSHYPHLIGFVAMCATVFQLGVIVELITESLSSGSSGELACNFTTSNRSVCGDLLAFADYNQGHPAPPMERMLGKQRKDVGMFPVQ